MSAIALSPAPTALYDSSRDSGSWSVSTWSVLEILGGRSDVPTLSFKETSKDDEECGGAKLEEAGDSGATYARPEEGVDVEEL